ncbi:MAG: RNA-binding transcriptional accessory protein, partial [Firmicutes bacterium]|nr:RNA-binding transcriptional accessory protein [Bacillota bacterium]
MDIHQKLSVELSVKPEHTANIVALLGEGNTVPFIARYRKEMTGAIDDQKLREFADRLEYLRGLDKRKSEVAASITEQGKMTPEIQAALDAAQTLTEVEDIYRPFRPKRRTRASIALERGLGPLAELILAQDPLNGDPLDAAAAYVDPDKGVHTPQEAVAGACDVIAEQISDTSECRKYLRGELSARGVAHAKLDEKQENAYVYETYKDFCQSVAKLVPHRVLALNRGEKEECLKVWLSTDEDAAAAYLQRVFCKGNNAYTALIRNCCVDAFGRLIFPSLEREVRADLTDTAAEQAIKMFENNLRPLLLQPPVRGRAVIGLDPAYRTGCKIAVVDATGKLLAHKVIYPTPPQNKIDEAKAVLTELIAKTGADVISIGNG